MINIEVKYMGIFLLQIELSSSRYVSPGLTIPAGCRRFYPAHTTQIHLHIYFIFLKIFKTKLDFFFSPLTQKLIAELKSSSSSDSSTDCGCSSPT